MKQNKLNLASYFKKYAFLYLLATICMLVGVTLDMVFPIVVQHIVDDVLIARKMELINMLLLAILGIGVGRFFFCYAREWICDYSGSKIASEVRINLFGKIQSLSANFFDGINSGELMSRVKDDVDHIWDVACFMAILAVEVALRTIIAMFFMIRINWVLSIIPIIGMIITGIIAVKMENKLDVLFGDLEQENSELNNTAAENLAGVRTVKAFAREGFEIAKFHKHNQKYYDLNIDLSRVFVKYNPKIQVITRLLSAATCLFGGLMIIKGNPFAGGKPLTIGELMALLGYVSGLVWPIEMIGWLANGISRAKASLRRINNIYEQLPQIRDESALASGGETEEEIADALFTTDDLAGEIEFDHVTYKVGERTILDDVSFKIGAGQTLGIMGATGSGKTTIINLLKRMYDVTSGSIKIDGVDIRELPLAVLRRAVSCVMQDIFLFSDTIEGNIRLGERETMTVPQVRSALEKSHSAEFVDKMEEKENTVIGERGVGLSGGQKQRITIARALARKTPVLVLDDSTSALDTETEQDIQKVLADLHGMTKLIIAHRISAVRKADKIIVLEKGRIAEEGTHDELLKLGGLYKETYDSQY
ncbi:MAG: ABC transporter ATP-binding protein [Treponema sp.]|nr:ABC transporter ATP-binding protein [Treponema sp.]